MEENYMKEKLKFLSDNQDVSSSLSTMKQEEKSAFQRSLLEGEIPLMVYRYLKGEGFGDMAEEFFTKKLKDKPLLEKFGLLGTKVPLTMAEHRDIANKMEETRLENVINLTLGVAMDSNSYTVPNATGRKVVETSFCSVSSEARNAVWRLLKGSDKQNKNHRPYRKNVLQLMDDMKLGKRVTQTQLHDSVQSHKRLQLSKRILGHCSSVYCMTLDCSKCTLFTGGDDGLIKAWKLDTCLLTATFRGHVKAVCDIHINYDNTKMISGGADTTVRVWCLKSCGLLVCLRGHDAPIESVHFSPYPVGKHSYLVSTSVDGTLCFWKTSNTSNLFRVGTKPIKFTENSAAIKSFRINCCALSPGGTYVVLGTSDPTLKVYKLSNRGPFKTLEVYGHNDEVESIEFDHTGCRFASGSKDGTIRVWSLSISSWCGVTIDVKNDVDVNCAALTNAKRKKKLSINAVCWSCNDSHISCGCPDFAIRSYDASSRLLVSSMIGHTDQVTVLQHHPLVDHILLSAGCDGLIHMWDIRTGSCLVKFDNDLGEQGFGAVYDLRFINEGRDFVSCDNNGNWSLYSVWSPEHFQTAPAKQFFNTDYWELTHDPTTGRVFDSITGFEPHLMSPPIFVDFFGTPYGDHVQRLVPGTNFFGDQPYQKHVTIKAEDEDDKSSLLCEGGGEGPGLITTGSVEGVRQVGVLHKKTIASLYVTHHDWFTRFIVNPIGTAELSEGQEQRKCLYRHEQQIHNSIRPRGSAFDQKEQRIGRLLRLQSLQKQRKLEKETRRVVALRSEIHESPHSMHIDGEQSSSSQSNNASEEHFSSSSEFSVELNDIHVSRRHNRSARLRTLRPRHISGNSENENEETNSNNGRSVQSQPPPLPDDYPSEWVSIDTPRHSPYVPQVGDQVYYYFQGHRLYIKELFKQNVTNLLPDVETIEELDRLVFVTSNPSGAERCQVDDVQFIYKNPLVCKLKLRRLDYVVSLAESTSHEFIEFEFHDLRNVTDFILLKEVVEASMRIEWNPGQRIRSLIDDCWWFGSVLNRSPMDKDMPESPFLCYVVRWDTGEYDHLSPWDIEPVEDKTEEAVISSPDLNVESTRCSSSRSASVNKIVKKLKTARQCSPIRAKEHEINDLYQRCFTCATVEDMIERWGEEDPFSASDRIANAIENFMEHPVAVAFSIPVDLKLFADYWTLVPHPMDLSKVVQRLRNRFYRCKNAILFDLNCIRRNALTYNRPGALITRFAQIFYSILEEVVGNSQQTIVSNDHPLLIANSQHFLARNRRNRRKRRARTSTTSSSHTSNNNSRTPTTYRNSNAPMGANEQLVQWINDSFRMLADLMNLKDCEPFLTPVNTEEVPTYTEVIKQPMDFNTVMTKLKEGIYIHPNEVTADIRLIFENSRRFNTNPRSRIYSMTMRLANQFQIRADSFEAKWRHLEPLKRPLTRSIIRNIYLNFAATTGTSSFSADSDYHNSDNSCRNQSFQQHHYATRRAVSAASSLQDVSSIRKDNMDLDDYQGSLSKRKQGLENESSRRKKIRSSLQTTIKNGNKFNGEVRSTRMTAYHDNENDKSANPDNYFSNLSPIPLRSATRRSIRILRKSTESQQTVDSPSNESTSLLMPNQKRVKYELRNRKKQFLYDEQPYHE